MRRRVTALDGDIPLDEDTQEDIVAGLEQDFATRTAQQRVLFACLILLPTPAFAFAPHARQYPVRALVALVSLVASAAALYYAQPRLLRLNTVLVVMISVQALLFAKSALSSADSLWALPAVSLVTVFVIERWTDEAAAELYGLRQKKFRIPRSVPITRLAETSRAAERTAQRRERVAAILVPEEATQ